MNSDKFFHYKLPSENGLEGWAEIVVCSNGFFAAVSDYGNFAFRWTNFEPRQEFRKFLLDCDGDYVRRKLDNSTVFDIERTHGNMRHAVCLARRLQVLGYEITAEQARQAYDEIDYVGNEFELNEWFGDWAQYLDDYTAIACYKPSPGITAFVERTLPRLKKLIREELFKEGVLG